MVSNTSHDVANFKEIQKLLPVAQLTAGKQTVPKRGHRQESFIAYH